MTGPREASGSRYSTLDGVLLASAFCCCGFLTFLPFLVMGVRDDRRALKIAAAIYGAGAAVGVLLMTLFNSGTTSEAPLGEPGGTGTQSLAETPSLSMGENIGAWILMAVWVAGMIHALVALVTRPRQSGQRLGPVWHNGPTNLPPSQPPPAGWAPAPAQDIRWAPTARYVPPPLPAPRSPPPSELTTSPDLQVDPARVIGFDQETVAEPHRPKPASIPGTDPDRTAPGSVLPAPGPDEVRSQTEAHSYAPGETIGDRFEVTEVLGSGGFSKVYRVRDAIEDEERALKLFANAAGYDAVRREIGALRKVDHPNVVKVFWADRTDEGEWYLITEYLEGERLDEYTAGGKQLRDREAIDVALEVLSALVAIHPDPERLVVLDRRRRQGELIGAEYDELMRGLSEDALVHRDIKPNNIILTRSGAKLLDFNISSRVGDPVNTVSGTPPYQPPDAATDRWDVSTDLFAVGVTLYELLCNGEHPYPHLRPTLGREPRDPRQFRKDLDPGLSRFLLQACAADRKERFATAAQMRTALESIRTGQ